MNLLERIVFFKKKEVYERKFLNPVNKLEKTFFFERNPFSLVKKLKEKKSGIISEFKLRSPSKGIINKSLSSKIIDNPIVMETIIKDYELSGVSGISILTDQKFFSGKNEFIKKVRSSISIPIIRKEFIIDEYQILESKAIGADVILLIANILTKNQIKNFSRLAKSIGLEIILEIHDEVETDKITENLDIIGINNRNLKTFNLDFKNCLKLSKKIPEGYTKIAESGIDNINYIIELKKQGFKGFLIGEYFMKKENPGKACEIFVKSLLSFS
ncbi:indole-3-glycerol phosphate synthase TrpC [Blattabacterium cuenoti]|uniref:indole-3-glycerol phosphate synthase TrpC n=1 Tax=Blattabacterium cuenoti TaxID=1653831 RepID=UPI00163C4577|nr:indole-3-glycerol phosphate synthase TrpC [Blattabacterium cuenoti]